MISEKADAQKKNQGLKIGAFLHQITISLVVLAIYLAIAIWLLPAGVNRNFVAQTARFLIPAAIVLAFAYFSLILLQKKKIQLPPASKENLIYYFILILLPLTPIAQYILLNQDMLTWTEAVLFVLVSLLIISIPVIIVPLLLRKTGAFLALVALGAAFSFSIANMASLSTQFAWHEQGALGLQLAYLAVVWALIWLLLYFKMPKFLALIVVVFFIANPVSQLLTKEEVPVDPATDQSENPLLKLIGDREPASKPDIYLLVYDAYVGSETLSAYGIDNRPQEQFLIEQGFTIYPKTYSLGGFTVYSMSTVFNASTNMYGSIRRGVSGDGVVHNLLKGYGYRTHGVFSSAHFFRGIESSYDYSFPGYGSSVNLLREGILVGEFKFDLDFDKITREEYLQEKRGILTRNSSRPAFLYSHSNLPGHSQNSGACLPDETEQYQKRLDRANAEMKKDIELVLQNHPDAIVIVAGDHGPYLTKNCTTTNDVYDISEITRLDIQDRFGTFLAIRWPSSGYEAYDEITVLQDIFPSVFAYLFDDPGLLEARVEPRILDRAVISGATVVDGIIQGGINDGEPLFPDSLDD